MLSKIKEAYKNRDLKALDELAVPCFRITNKKTNCNSFLMLSCNNIEHLSKIESLSADCIILNLEDGVSKEDKPFALILCAIFLTMHKVCDKKLIVRVNPLNKSGYEEITYLNQFMPDAIRVAKIRELKEVSNVLALLHHDVELHLSIETSQAWYNLSRLKVGPRVTTFYLGILDLFADMKLPQSLVNLNNPTMHYILSHFLITCKAMNVKPVSFVYQEYENIKEFKKWLELEKSMGYDSKGCISPTQVDLLHEIFVDEELEIKRALEIVRLFEMHRDCGVTGFVDSKYGFVDEPIYKGALALLNKSS